MRRYALRRYFLIWLRGVAMGAADIVPGVSGGTIAFVSGIYEELVESLRRLTPKALGVWRRQGLRAFWRHINGGFLVALLTGILVSLFTLAHLVNYALAHHAVLVWSFFFGLILASIVHIARQLALRQWPVFLALLLGALAAAGIAQLPPANLPDAWWVMLGAGGLAICAMILPGVSGSFILLLIGVYPLFLQALALRQWDLLAAFATGCAVGLLAFSHLLSWLLRRFRQATLGLLTGFLIGSLWLVWPWRYLAGGLPVNLSPAEYARVTGADAQLLPALLMALLGLALVLALEVMTGHRNCAGGQPGSD